MNVRVHANEQHECQKEPFWDFGTSDKFYAGESAFDPWVSSCDDLAHLKALGVRQNERWGADAPILRPETESADPEETSHPG